MKVLSHSLRPNRRPFSSLAKPPSSPKTPPASAPRSPLPASSHIPLAPVPAPSSNSPGTPPETTDSSAAGSSPANNHDRDNPGSPGQSLCNLDKCLGPHPVRDVQSHGIPGTPLAWTDAVRPASATLPIVR